jgi:hypothetical protein
LIYPDVPDGREKWFLAALFALAVIKLALVWDQSVAVILGPHDDSLYVRRAWSLLAGEGFGPYDSTTLAKLPGFSFWLALHAWLGIPYLPALNVLFVAAGAYLCAGLRAAGVGALSAVLGYALLLFSPFTFDLAWTRVLREPLTTALLAAIAGSTLFILARGARGRGAGAHLGVLAAALVLSTMTREEDILLCVIPPAVAVLLLWRRWRAAPRRQLLAGAAALLAVPLLAVAAANLAARAWVEARYGLPILHDFGEGEFPRMIAAMRSVRAKRDNRYVPVSQEALGRLAREVPPLEPVIRRLPPPGPGTVSCQWLGVCTEWAAGWLLYWIKDAAHDAGLTRSLPEAQAYFRAVRRDIEAACREERLQCASKGGGLVAPYELRWTRALVQETWSLVAMLLRPDAAPRQDPSSVHGAALERMFAAVTGAAATGRAPPETRGAQLGASVWLEPWARAYALGALLLMLGGFAAFVYLFPTGRHEAGPLWMASAVIGAYLAIRVLALAYLALTMGRYDPRMVMATHVAITALAPALVAAGWARWRGGRSSGIALAAS